MRFQKKQNYSDRGQVRACQEEGKGEGFKCKGNQGNFQDEGTFYKSEVGYTTVYSTNASKCALKPRDFRANKPAEIIVSINSMGTWADHVVSIWYKVLIYTLNH